MNAHLYRIICNTVTQHDSDSSHVPGSTLQLKMGRTDAVCNLSRWRLPLCGWSRRSDLVQHRGTSRQKQTKAVCEEWGKWTRGEGEVGLAVHSH